MQWDPSGGLLLSSGSDGTVKIWKRMLSASGLGSFELIAEQAGEEESDSEQSSLVDDDQDT